MISIGCTRLWWFGRLAYWTPFQVKVSSIDMWPHHKSKRFCVVWNQKEWCLHFCFSFSVLLQLFWVFIYFYGSIQISELLYFVENACGILTRIALNVSLVAFISVLIFSVQIFHLPKFITSYFIPFGGVINCKFLTDGLLLIYRSAVEFMYLFCILYLYRTLLVES